MKEKKYLLAIYMLLLHIFLIIVLIQSNFISLVTSKIQQSELSAYYHNMVAFHYRIDQNLAENSSLFIGDSLTQGLAVSNIVNRAVNYGIGNDTTLGVINRLPYYQSIKNSKNVVLAIGHNDFKFRGKAEILENFRLILNELSVANQVTLLAVLPVDESTQSYINNSEIEDLNDSLEVLSRNYNNVNYLNINQVLVDSEGLSSKYHTGDGVHLNKAGNAIWIGILEEKLSSITVEPYK